MKRAGEEGGCNGARKRYMEDRGSMGYREGGKLQGMYPDEDTGQYTVKKIAQNVAYEIALVHSREPERSRVTCFHTAFCTFMMSLETRKN